MDSGLPAGSVSLRGHDPAWAEKHGRAVTAVCWLTASATQLKLA